MNCQNFENYKLCALYTDPASDAFATPMPQLDDRLSSTSSSSMRCVNILLYSCAFVCELSGLVGGPRTPSNPCLHACSRGYLCFAVLDTIGCRFDAACLEGLMGRPVSELQFHFIFRVLWVVDGPRLCCWMVQRSRRKSRVRPVRGVLQVSS